MYLRSITLQGFKSFPDKTVLEFDRGMTAVVGPNGSGKSNIADAVRWVLGEQSTKNLRSSKMEDVIFGGTRQRAAHGFCRVVLSLDNTDRRLKSDTDTVDIAREYYRSGESKYLINGKTVRLKDVNELLMDTGLGRDGYSIVGQGKIEEIISSKSSDRREMLEEASGISHYRYKRAETIKKLELAEDNLIRLRDIMSELESRVGPLARQAKKAESFLILADKRKHLEIGLLLIRLENARNGLRDVENKLAAVSAQYESTDHAVAELISAIDKADENAKLTTAQIETLAAQKQELERQISDKESAVRVALVTAEHAREDAERIKRQNDSDADQTESVKCEISAQEAKIAEIADDLEKSRSRQESLTRELSAARAESGKLTGDLKTLSDELARVILDISHCDVDRGSAESTIDEINIRLVDLDDELARLKQDAIDNQIACSASEAEQAAARENFDSVKNSLEGAKLKLSLRNDSSSEAKDALDSLRLRLADAKNKLNFLLDAEKNMEGYAGAVKAVIKAGNGGRLPGIEGTVASLIKTDEMYQTAVETALGAAVQHIVTSSDNDAKKAIYYLKSNELGRCTFLPVSSIKGKRLDAPGIDGSFGYIGLAEELIDYDPVYEDVMLYLLGRTVIAEDLDCATVMAKKYSYKFKIVTLDGQVINAGGSMTGGSKAQSSSFLARGGNIEHFKSEIDSLEKAIVEADKRLRTAEAGRGEAQAEVSALESELVRASDRRYKADEAYRAAQTALDNVSARLSQTEAQRAVAVSRLDQLKKSAISAVDLKNELEKGADDLRKRMSELSDSGADKDDELHALEISLAELNLNIVALYKEKESASARLDELRSRLLDISERSSELSSEYDAALERIDRLNREAETAKLAVEALKKSVEAIDIKTAELVVFRSGCENEVSSGRNEERELTETREKLAQERVRLEQKRDSLAESAQNADSVLWNEYQLTEREARKLDIIIDDPVQAGRDLASLKAQIKALGNINVGAIDEYKEVSERYEFMKKQLDDVEKSKKELLELTAELTKTMTDRFNEVFMRINDYFAQAFSKLFGGGTASLYLENETDLLDSEIGVKAQPPGKNVRNMNLLSGGEKGLCAVALIFAILRESPAPFCIFDEVEAALDDVNVVRYAEYVRSMTDSSQFILITHRRGTMEEADTLYGVTMQDEGISKLLKLNTAQTAAQLGLD